MKWLICLAGSIASGKTTLAHSLRDKIPESRHLAFGDVVRRRASSNQPKPTRSDLQEAGLQLIREGWSTFVDQLLSELDDVPVVLIVEGIRHQEAIQALRERLRPQRTLVVFLEVTGFDQLQRLEQRGESENALSHEVEKDIAALKAASDLVLPSGRPGTELATSIIERLQRADASLDQP